MKQLKHKWQYIHLRFLMWRCFPEVRLVVTAIYMALILSYIVDFFS